jgi:uncharacterized Zn-binding protein involved in type VI secretion
MAAIVRIQLDKHIGHASPTPNPFHATPYKTGSPDVFTNAKKTVRIGDETECSDKATAGSPNVFINGIAVHRKNDSTSGHASWPPNAAATGSPNVFANEA